MKLQQLRYFEATCRLNSFSQAADELHISQPSISMAIRDLEKEFGVALIRRRYQGFDLTEEGERLREMASSLLRHADHISESMQAMGQRRRPVRLGIPPMIAMVMLPAIYHELNVRYLDVLLSTEERGTKSLIQDLRDNALDMAFLTHNAPLPSMFDTIPIASLETVWCARREHPMAGADTIAVEELEDEPLVFFSGNFSFQESITERFKAAGIVPHVLHMTEQLSTVQRLIRSGSATGFLLSPIASAMSGCAAVPLRPHVVVQISLAWNRSGAQFRDMRRFISLCQQKSVLSCFTEPPRF